MDQQDIKADAMRLGVQAALMRELLHTPMWECFLEYARQMVEDCKERAILKTAGDFEKGVVGGMRDILRIPENLIMWAERANRN